MQPSPRHFKRHIRSPSTYHGHNQIEAMPLGSSCFESSYSGEHRPSTPFDDGLPPSKESQHSYHSWYIQRAAEHITDIQSNDVLSGRGGATNTHLGNRAFRELVKHYKIKYIKAKKSDKPKVAAEVVRKIRQTGGRFLQKVNITPQGVVVWEDIGDDKAREKTCQALREGAPEIRRRKDTSKMNDGEKLNENEGSLSTASTFDRMESDEDTKLLLGGRTQILRTSFEAEKKEAVISITGAPMVIQPSMTLLCGGPADEPLAIPIDHLDEPKREIYLRDFLPPNPSIQKKQLSIQPIVAPVTDAVGNDNGMDHEWDIKNITEL